MVLILGGRAAGKTAFVQSLGYPDEAISDDVASDRPVLDRMEALVRSDPASADALLPLLLKKEIVICQEVGSGVIPINPSDRAFREAVGRLCCALAKEASAVVRVVSGIPITIKGELSCTSN